MIRTLTGKEITLPLFLCLSAAAGLAQQTPAVQKLQPQVNAAGEPAQEQRGFELPAGVTVERDLTYAKYGPREMKLDLYHPFSPRGISPGVVFIHGGAWTIGNKSGFSRQAAYLAAKGYVCVSIDYRLSQEAPYPAALYDSKAAVRWMRANAAKYNIDPNRIAAVGGSSGGQLAALLGTTADVRTMEGDGGNAQFSSRVQAVVAFNPLTDFVSMLARTQNPKAATQAIVPFLGGMEAAVPEIYVDASPVAHVSATSAPFLFLHGTSDTTMPYQQSLEMIDALHSVGVRAELYSAKDANHGFFNSPPFYQPSTERMEQFLNSVFHKP
jgi:arylsulfatase A